MLVPSIIVGLLVLLLDQLSKIFILPLIDAGQSIKILPFLNFNLAHNYGAAFGILSQESGWQRWLFVAVAVLVSIILLLWAKRLSSKDWGLTIAIGLLLGGAWGNMLDRIWRGTVIDFIDFYIRDWHWYLFNVADAGICVGAVLLLWFSFTYKQTA